MTQPGERAHFLPEARNRICGSNTVSQRGVARWEPRRASVHTSTLPPRSAQPRLWVGTKRRNKKAHIMLGELAKQADGQKSCAEKASRRGNRQAGGQAGQQAAMLARPLAALPTNRISSTPFFGLAPLAAPRARATSASQRICRFPLSSAPPPHTLYVCIVHKQSPVKSI
eukprot:358867-Chlamydomonas_euryale.AAC.5